RRRAGIQEPAENRSAGAEPDGVAAGDQASEREGTGHPLGVDQQDQAQHGKRQPGNDRCRQQGPGTRSREDGPRAMLPLTARALSVMSSLWFSQTDRGLA